VKTRNDAVRHRTRQGNLISRLARLCITRTRWDMLIAWTTVAAREEAEQLARTAVERRLAACVQIDGPIASHCIWQGRAERTEEFRLCFKFLPTQQAALEAWLFAHHPYETPEWLVVRAEGVGEKYLSWALANATSLPL
jgi:periplasmic divalent cation tolerance protein